MYPLLIVALQGLVGVWAVGTVVCLTLVTIGYALEADKKQVDRDAGMPFSILCVFLAIFAMLWPIFWFNWSRPDKDGVSRTRRR